MITKLFGATILLPLIFSFGLDAQSSKPDQFPATDKPDAQSPLSNQPLGQDYDRPVSWKLVVPNILADQKAIWLSPSKVAKDHNWIPALCIAGATAALFTLDPYQGRYFHTTSTFQGFNGVFTGNATGLGIIIAPVSLYVTGLARRDTKMQHTALLAGEAVADAEIVTTVLKDIDQRARPVTFTPHRNYWHSWFEAKALQYVVMAAFPTVMPSPHFPSPRLSPIDIERSMGAIRRLRNGRPGGFLQALVISSLRVGRICRGCAWLLYQPLCSSSLLKRRRHSIGVWHFSQRYCFSRRSC